MLRLESGRYVVRKVGHDLCTRQQVLEYWRTVEPRSLIP